MKTNTNDFILHSPTRRDELVKKYSQPSNVWQKPYEDSSDTTTDPAKSRARNDILNELLWLADDYYGQLTHDLYSTNAWRNTGFDAVKLGLGAAGAVVGGEELKAVLAATGTAVQGLNSSIDKNFYLQQTVEAIVAAMDTERANDMKALIDGMGKPANAYPLSKGLLDVKKYALDSTLTHALIALSEESANKAKTTQEELRKAVSDQQQNLSSQILAANEMINQISTTSGSYSAAAMANLPEASRIKLAADRYAVLRVALIEIDKVLQTPLLSDAERQYFASVQTTMRAELSNLASAYDLH